jgi:hypothetical protein
MRTATWLLAAFGAVAFAGAASAQTPARVRGTVDSLSGNMLTVTTRAGGKATVTLADPVHVLAVSRAALADIKPGSSVGIASVAQADGTLRALEVTLVPPGMPNTPLNMDWDLGPSSKMTNGAVGGVVVGGASAGGTTDRTLTVDYGKGKQAIVVPESAAIVTLAPADRAMLAPGASVVVFARKANDGALSAGAVAVGTPGVVPPM